MTTVAEPMPSLTEANILCVETTGAPVETEAEITEEERAWIAKWLDKSPEWSAEKWNAMGHVLGVKFS
ncbi:hypothetical protein OH809_24115 [Streptomyces sp. NBC_00873]|uniref:hypothetical protein n=1 Tax=unclassified Streptomyces TaxID=2593676 RepID=UPI003867619A|nr:hypothetical protein OH809_24115 [Streptomyces sp. NBC_00873]WTA44484.1 hypothetical protein OH821_19185 [Streptomyces sp. NBC_00842]